MGILSGFLTEVGAADFATGNGATWAGAAIVGWAEFAGIGSCGRWFAAAGLRVRTSWLALIAGAGGASALLGSVRSAGGTSSTTGADFTT
jgi:hypothetical protein